MGPVGGTESDQTPAEATVLSPYSTGNGVRVGYQTQLKSTQKNMKCTWPTPAFYVVTQRNLYSTDWRRGLALGVTQILALGNAKIYQHVGISNTKFWRQGHCPTPTPDARYFASQWNIGFRSFLEIQETLVLQ